MYLCIIGFVTGLILWLTVIWIMSGYRGYDTLCICCVRLCEYMSNAWKEFTVELTEMCERQLKQDMQRSFFKNPVLLYPRMENASTIKRLQERIKALQEENKCLNRCLQEQLRDSKKKLADFTKLIKDYEALIEKSLNSMNRHIETMEKELKELEEPRPYITIRVRTANNVYSGKNNVYSGKNYAVHNH